MGVGGRKGSSGYSGSGKAQSYLSGASVHQIGPESGRDVAEPNAKHFRFCGTHGTGGLRSYCLSDDWKEFLDHLHRRKAKPPENNH